MRVFLYLDEFKRCVDFSSFGLVYIVLKDDVVGVGCEEDFFVDNIFLFNILDR